MENFPKQDWSFPIAFEKRSLWLWMETFVLFFRFRNANWAVWSISDGLLIITHCSSFPSFALHKFVCLLSADHLYLFWFFVDCFSLKVQLVFFSFHPLLLLGSPLSFCLPYFFVNRCLCLPLYVCVYLPLCLFSHSPSRLGSITVTLNELINRPIELLLWSLMYCI